MCLLLSTLNDIEPCDGADSTVEDRMMNNCLSAQRSAAGWPPGAPATPNTAPGSRPRKRPRSPIRGESTERAPAWSCRRCHKRCAVHRSGARLRSSRSPGGATRVAGGREQTGRPRHLPLKRGSRVRVVSGGTVLTGPPLPGRTARRAAKLQISRVPSKMCASDICLAGQRLQGDPGPQAVPIAPPIRAFARSTVGCHDVCRWVVRAIAQCVHARPESGAGRQAPRVLRRHVPPHRP